MNLEVDDEWAAITGMLRSPVWIDRRKVVEVAPVPRGIMFRSDDGVYDSVMFWCDRRRALAAFVRHGWPVPAPTRPVTEPR